MVYRALRYIGRCALLALCIGVAKAHAEGPEQRPVLIIISAETDIRDISTSDLRRVFLGHPTEVSGLRLLPFNLPLRIPAREVIDERLLGLSSTQVPAFWIDQKIRQAAEAPRELPSMELMIRVVASVPGALGYLRALPREMPAQIRVLAVDGHGPADPRYLFR